MSLGPHARAQPPADLNEHLVPGVVAQDVVDFLEVVQVQEQDVDGGAVRVREGAGEAVVEQLAVGQPGQSVPERQRLELGGLCGEVCHGPGDPVLGNLGRGHIAEAPHASDHLVRDFLRAGIAFKSPAVAEFQDVVAFRRGIGVEGLDLLDELGRIPQLVQDEGHDGLVVPGGQHLPRDAPHGDELIVDAGDLALAADHQDAVGGGFERRAQQRHGLAEAVIVLRPVRGVPDRGDHARGTITSPVPGACTGEEDGSGHLGLELRTVPPHPVGLHGSSVSVSFGGSGVAVGVGAAAEVEEQPLEPVPEPLGQEHAVVRAHELPAGVPEHALRGGVDHPDGPVLGHHQQGVGAGFHQVPVARDRGGYFLGDCLGTVPGASSGYDDAVTRLPPCEPETTNETFRTLPSGNHRRPGGLPWVSQRVSTRGRGRIRARGARTNRPSCAIT